MTTTTSNKAGASVGAESFIQPLFKQAAASFEQAGQAASLVRDQTVALIELGEQLSVDAVRKGSEVASQLSAQRADLASVTSLYDFRKAIDAGLGVSEQLFAAQRKIAATFVESFAPAAG